MHTYDFFMMITRSFASSLGWLAHQVHAQAPLPPAGAPAEGARRRPSVAGGRPARRERIEGLEARQVVGHGGGGWWRGASPGDAAAAAAVVTNPAVKIGELVRRFAAACGAIKQAVERETCAPGRKEHLKTRQSSGREVLGGTRSRRGRPRHPYLDKYIALLLWSRQQGLTPPPPLSHR